MNMLERATELLAKAVAEDGVVLVTYSMAGMAVTVGEDEWTADGSQRNQVEMEAALRNLQGNDLLENKPFGQGINNSQAILRPTPRAYREFAPSD